MKAEEAQRLKKVIEANSAHGLPELTNLLLLHMIEELTETNRHLDRIVGILVDTYEVQFDGEKP